MKAHYGDGLLTSVTEAQVFDLECVFAAFDGRDWRIPEWLKVLASFTKGVR